MLFEVRGVGSRVKGEKAAMKFPLIKCHVSRGLRKKGASSMDFRSPSTSAGVRNHGSGRL
jgi:hypothetical protein